MSSNLLTRLTKLEGKASKPKYNKVRFYVGGNYYKVDNAGNEILMTESEVNKHIALAKKYGDWGEIVLPVDDVTE